ncbi:DUF4181 domain-containing protein [Alkaliphilus metalliredigens]
MYISIFISIFIFWIVIEKIVINKLNIKKKKFLFQHVNKIHTWLEALLFILTLSMMFVNEYYFFIGITAIFCFRIVIEWKFEKESKTYILSILNASICLLLLIMFKLFFVEKIILTIVISHYTSSIQNVKQLI